MNEQLPSGWALESLGELCLFNPKHPPNTDKSILVSFVPMPAVSDTLGQIMPHGTEVLNKVWKGYTHFAEQDVIFAKITPCMENGKIAVAKELINGMACGSTEFHVMRSLGAIIPEYLYHFLRQKAFRSDAEQSMTGAVGQRRVPADYLKNYVIPLPPLAEQKRIVAKLDTLLARITRAREELAAVKQLLDAYRISVISNAYTGQLTHTWRGDNPCPSSKNALKSEGISIEVDQETLDTLPDTWHWVTAGQVCEIKSGITLGKKYRPDTTLIEVPYLRVANVQRGWLNLTEVKTIAVTAEEAKTLALQVGDILMNEGGDRDKLGRGWIWEGQIPQCIHQNHVFRLRLKTQQILPTYISIYANYFGQQYFMDQGKQTTNLASISKSKLSSFPIPLPPFAEMKIILQKVETVFKFTNQVEAEIQKAEALLTRLEQATLAKAFRGELVPQDPTDEPAPQLLARLRAQRATEAAPTKKTKRTIKTTSDANNLPLGLLAEAR